MEETKSPYKILVGKLEGKRPLRKYSRIRESNVKFVLKNQDAREVTALNWLSRVGCRALVNLAINPLVT
jgi:hypothetical protein